MALAEPELDRLVCFLGSELPSELRDLVTSSEIDSYRGVFELRGTDLVIDNFYRAADLLSQPQRSIEMDTGCLDFASSADGYVLCLLPSGEVALHEPHDSTFGIAFSTFVDLMERLTRVITPEVLPSDFRVVIPDEFAAEVEALRQAQRR